MGKNTASQKRRTPPEFWLVVIMLLTLTILVVFILRADIPVPSATDTPKVADLLEYRKTILTIIITAFGAWVGAGAAYFFGRENLRVATESLLQMHQSTAERFKQLPIRNLPRKPLDWKVPATETIANVQQKINRKSRWFIPIIKSDGSLENVIHEDAVWVYIDRQSAANVPHATILQKTIADVADFIAKDPQLKEDYDSIYIPVSLDDKAGEVHESMLRKDVYLAVIINRKGKPEEFFTTADMRIFLLQSP
jgi:hypothetical protein